jgi:hypothetical protein
MERIDAHHARNNSHEHHFLNRKIAPAEKRHDPLIIGYLPLLQNETKENAGNQPERKPCCPGDFQWTHDYTLLNISRAMMVPETIIESKNIQLLTAS